MFKLLTNANNVQAYKAQIAARYAGKSLEVPAFNYGADNATPAFLAKSPLGKVPVLETPSGPIFEANAVARYIARGTPLYGKCDFEAALVDQWVEFAASELELPLSCWLLPYTCAGFPRNEVAEKRAKTDVRKAMAALNAHLAARTFLVGERVTLADICVACSMLDGYKVVIDGGFRKEFRALNRWFTTVVNQPHFIEVVGEVHLCEKAPVPPKVAAPVAEEKKEQPKKEQPKKEEKKEEKKPAKKEDDEEEDDVPREKKAPNPLDMLPPSKFVMDNWKRVYSNEDTKTVALPYFFENYDAEGYSVWTAKYKYELDAPQVFMVANLCGGFIQRLEGMRKHGFGSIIIFGEPGKWDVEGVFLFRGTEMPQAMKEVDDYELYNWTKLDVAAERTKIEEFFLWEGSFGGRTMNQGKIFK